MSHKSGFVNIVGKPNVGKSTLLNALMGQDLSVVTPKAQTTRHRIKAILNSDEYQIVFSDTPGIMKPAYKLHEKMLHAVEETFTDADLILFVTEFGDRKLEEDLAVKLKNRHVPLFVLLNKVDKGNQEEVEAAVQLWKELLDPEVVLPVSALHNFHLDVLLNKILEVLPEGPAYFDKDEDISDRNTRFFVTEIIRGRILQQYQKEVPYSVEVIVTEYKESPEIDRIKVVIYCARESQKAILLGHGGAAIKKLGIDSRKKIEEFVGKQVYLETTVKVADDWRDNDKMLKRFGYE
ncbi:MAG: GTPase Era [Bacteroidetes bacterium]|nr:GTPase Era [Bacteroidota bacterium]MBK9319295.1 GTPase Era [Bacteroidota bacterium]